MNLDALSGRDRQICRTLLEMMRRENVGVDEMIRLMDIKMRNQAKTEPARPEAKYGICPECGRPLLRCLRTGQIYCAKCRWSKIGEGK